MAAHQLPGQVDGFARYLRAVTGRLDPGSGWYGVFRRRDPDGLTACLRGTEIPPWDVVASLLQDLAADDEETAHARGLHSAAAAAHDRRPGGGEALRERLELMRREQAHAAGRGRDLLHRLAAVPEGTPVYRELAHDLSWANDDHTRATARCAELATRIAALAPPPGLPSGAAPYVRGPVPGPVRPGPVAGVFGPPGPPHDRDAFSGAERGGTGPEPEPWAGQGHGTGHFTVAARPGPDGPDRPDGSDGAAGGVGREWAGTTAAARGPGAWGGPAVDGAAGGGWTRADAVADGPGGGAASGPERADGADGADGGAGREWAGTDAASSDPGAWARPGADGAEPPQPLGGGSSEDRRAPGREARRGSKRRPRGARYAWLDDAAEESAGEPVPVPGVPELPVAAVRPRGARFGGGAETEPTAATGPGSAAPAGEEDRRAALATVATLRRLRAEGRGGEAHVLLCEAASGPSARLPVLAAEMHRSGLGADWPTLLWEVASLPPERLAEAAGALAGAGRDDDCGRLLRQGVARPADEIADAVLALGDAGALAEADALLAAFLRVRSPEEGARIATAEPRRLVPQLLSAARAVSPGCERDLVHALRVAGLISA
ncbi:hypothetical protein ACFVY9_25165 [Streptomyces sp. NPDC059544]|uniref:hypothetical protein n=1 Tax=Streptomyces sp. NPDC059544 TaxID=3346861 RepID=UPI003675D260